MLHHNVIAARVAAWFRCVYPILFVAALTLAVGVSSAVSSDETSCARVPSGGRWRLQVQANVEWLVDACGRRFFSIGVNTVTPDKSSPADTTDGWPQRVTQQLRGWGFNTVGAFSSRALELPSMPELDLGWRADFHWKDPFAPSIAERFAAAAREATLRYKAAGYRIGYFSDNETGWWNGALFTFYLKAPATNYTKQELIAFIRRYYDDDWERFTGDFIVGDGISSFADLLRRAGAHPFLRPGGNGIRLIRAWTGVVAKHYYEVVYRALRAADPDALIFGDRLPSYYDPDAVRAMAPYVDAIATNYDVDSPDGWIAHYYFDGLRQLSGHKPIIISEWYFAALENRTGNLNNGHLMIVQTQAERARGAANAARNFARDPDVIGLHWFQYRDEPRGGRPQDGEDYDFGLVDINDRPYEELTAALATANHDLAGIHRNAAVAGSNDSRRDIRIPEAEIDTTSPSLARWPKEQSLLMGMTAPKPEVTFGDYFLAWDAHGLSLATDSMDYYDAHLIRYSTTFPASEAFRIDFGVDAGAGPRRFAFLLIPPKGFYRKGGLQMRIEVCRIEQGKCMPVPAARAIYQVSDRPRITAQISLPWRALGVPGPPPSRHLRVALAATGFFRSRWMSLGGAPPERTMLDTARWKDATMVGRRAASEASN